MYSYLASIRNGLRSSSLIPLLARNHGCEFIASRSLYTVPPSFVQEDNPTGSNSLNLNSRRSETWKDIRGGGRNDLNRIMNELKNERPAVVESTVDFVHIKILRNNCFVTVTDSRGNRKFGFSNGSLPDKAGAKCGRYNAEVAAEHVGRMCKSLGLKSVVIKVNGHIHFKKKKQAIMGWMEGYTNSRSDQTPVICVEDTTRKPHNGCRRPRARRS